MKHAAFGLLEHNWPAAHTTHWPVALHTWLVPQLLPAVFWLASMHACAPLAHEVTPLKHALLGLVAHATPSVHKTHEPLPLHTWLAPHDTPGPLLPKSTQVCSPLVHDVLPVLQGLGFDVQLTSAVQATQALVGLHTWLMPQETPAPRGAPSRQIVVPVEHEVTPRIHAAFGLLPQLWPAVHAPQKPLPSHT